MYVQELKDRVVHADYRVDPNAVAAAIWLRWKATHLAPSVPGRALRPSEASDGPGSGEVVEPE